MSAAMTALILCALAAVPFVAGEAGMRIPAPLNPEVGVPSVPTLQDTESPDLLTLAYGAIPIFVGGSGSEHGADLTHAVRFVDGDSRGFTFVNRATDETDTEFVYALPAPTVFHRLAVPEVLETPSPSQTFTRLVEVYGSSDGPEGPWVLLASGTLQTHSARGQTTELGMEAEIPVSWVRLRLQGGIEMLRDQMFLEFSEIIGNGTQERPSLVDHFRGSWWDRGVRLTLFQDGPAVTGCYDDGSPLEGTVTGNLLKATGLGIGDGVVSQFILGMTDDGEIRGVRSANGAPFALYTGAVATNRTVECAERTEPPLGCGSVIQGITFDFDSAVLRPESAPIIEMLAGGLATDPSSNISIEGHTSGEGDEAYNQGLSERRARAVVADLVARGIAGNRLSAVGRGESIPIATNDNENGRSMNRRVEVKCTGS